MSSILGRDEKRYLRLETDETRADSHLVSPNDEFHIEALWQRRFYTLLASSLFCISLLSGIIGWLRIFETSSYACPSSSILDTDVIVPYSPAPVTYVNKWLKGDKDTPRFLGKPSAEMDQAWHELLSATAIRLSEEELALSNNATSIRLQDGGFVGGLGISHSLHCVKRIKQYLHPEYYYTGEQDQEELFMHADHCLESLRQSVMCAADVSVYTLEWTPHSRYKPAVRVPQPHACVDWEALHGWMEGRAASLADAVGPAESIYNGTVEEAT